MARAKDHDHAWSGSTAITISPSATMAMAFPRCKRHSRFPLRRHAHLRFGEASSDGIDTKTPAGRFFFPRHGESSYRDLGTGYQLVVQSDGDNTPVALGHPAKRAARLLAMREAGKEVLALLAYFETGIELIKRFS